MARLACAVTRLSPVPVIRGVAGLCCHQIVRGYPWYGQPMQLLVMHVQLACVVTRLSAFQPASVARPACAVTGLSVVWPAYVVTRLSMVQLVSIVSYPVVIRLACLRSYGWLSAVRFGLPAQLSRYPQLSAVSLVCAVTLRSAVTSLLREWQACAVHLVCLFFFFFCLRPLQ